MELEKVTGLIGIVATASGYGAIQFGRFTRYRSVTIAWEQRVFESALVGGLLFCLCRLLAIDVLHRFPTVAGSEVVIYFKQAIPFPFSVSLLATAVTGALLGPGQNLIISRRLALLAATRRYGTSQQLAMLEALLHNWLLMFELENRRIIVGFVSQLPAFDRRAAFVSILPMLVGSRNEEGHVEFDQNYQAYYASRPPTADLDKLIVTVDVEKIETVNRFDPAIYQLWTSRPPREAAAK